MLIPDFDIYLSYAPEDREKVQSLVNALEDTGLKVWWEHHHLKPKEAIAMLQRQLNVSRVQMVVWSRNSAGSGRVQAEARIGADMGRLIATRIEHIVPPKHSAAVAYADLSDWRGGKEHRGIRKAFATIWSLIGKGLEIAEPPPVPRIIPSPAPEVQVQPPQGPQKPGDSLAAFPARRKKKSPEKEQAESQEKPKAENTPENAKVDTSTTPAQDTVSEEPASAPMVDTPPKTPAELEEEAWQEAYQANKRSLYKAFLKKYPDSEYAEEAKATLQRKSKSTRFLVWALITFLALYLVGFLVMVFINS